MVFVGVVGGIAAFGAIGIVVGPVFLALVAAILDYFDEKVIAPNKRQLDAQADARRRRAGAVNRRQIWLDCARMPGTSKKDLSSKSAIPYNSRPDE